MQLAFYAPLKPPDHEVPSGDRAVARLLRQALTLAGHNVQLASRLRTYDRGDAARQARLQALGTRAAQRLLRHYQRTPADAPDAWFSYHLYHKAPDPLGPVVARALGIPYIVAEATVAARHAAGPWAVGHAEVVDTLRAASAVVALNRRDIAAVAPLLRPGTPHVFLPPFLEASDYQPLRDPAARLAARRSLVATGADPALPWVIAVAMMRTGDKLASFQLLADALRNVSTPFELLVAGEGEAAAAVRAVFAARSRPVRWLGRQSATELRSLLPCCDLFAWPAVNEAFGMAMLEAQASGVPVVACAASADPAARGGVAEVVAHGCTGELCPSGDVAAFAGALDGLLGDDSRRARYATAARQRILDQHDVPCAARTLGNLLHSLAIPNTRPVS